MKSTTNGEVSGNSESFVFVSYAHADANVVVPHIEQLREAHSLALWYDEEIKPGARWRDELAYAVRDSYALVFMVSKNSVLSEHCSREVNFALDINRKIICVYLEDILLPDNLRFSLGDCQAVIAYRGDLVANVKKLADSLLPLKPSERMVKGSSGTRNFTRKDRTEPPSLLVLPFFDLDDQYQFILDGLIEDIVIGLSDSHWLRVFDFGTSFNVTRSDPYLAASDVSADFVLCGTMDSSQSEFRLNFRLLDIVRSRIVWSHQFQGTPEDLLTLEEKVRPLIVGSIEPEYLNHTAGLLTAKRTNLEQWELVVRARHLFWKTSKTTTSEARTILERVLTLDPGDSRAWSLLAMTHLNDVWNLWTDSVEASLKAANRASLQAIKTGSNNPAAYHARSAYTGTIGDIDQSFSDLNRALELNPYHAASLGDMSRTCALAGKLDEDATRFAEEALRISPRDPHAGLWCYSIALVCFLKGEFIDALLALERSASIRPDWMFSHLLRAVCLVEMGNLDRASDLIQSLDPKVRRYCLGTTRLTHAFVDPAPLRAYRDALLRAGLDEDEAALIVIPNEES